MVCPRCISAVETTLTELNIRFSKVHLGEVYLIKSLSDEQKLNLKSKLQKQGFELLGDKKNMLLEKIKNTIIHIVHHQNDPHKIGNLSSQLPELIGHSYPYLSSLFSEKEGITLERYLILQKIEKAKELLSYSELNVSEISYQLNYSSSQHLSRQFKSVTGMSPSDFIKQKKTKRKPLDNVK